MPIQPSDYIIGTIIFTLLSMGIFGIYAEVQSSNAAFIDGEQYSSFNSSFYQYDKVQSSVGGLKSSITDSQVDNGIFGTVNGVLNSLMNTVWSTFKFLFTSFGFMTDAYNGLCSSLGVPAFVPVLIGLLVVTIISFGIFAAITRTQL